MMTDTIWQNWLKEWNWILNLAKEKGWEYTELKIHSPVSIEEVNHFITKSGFKLPKDFIEVITTYSSKVEFRWQHTIPNENCPGVLFGAHGSFGPLWSFEDIAWIDNIPWVNDSIDGSTYYHENWTNKTGFIDEGGGDMAAFNVRDDGPDFEVLYLDHDGDDMHGARFGLSFVDFITRWSRLGCIRIGSQAWQVFHDTKLNLFDGGVKSQLWRDFLEGRQLNDDFFFPYKDKYELRGENYRSFHWNTQVREEGILQHGAKHGEWLEFDEWGTMVRKTCYVNGTKHGLQVDYYWNGTIKYETLFESDQKKTFTYSEIGKKQS